MPSIMLSSPKKSPNQRKVKPSNGQTCGKTGVLKAETPMISSGPNRNRKKIPI